MLRPEDQFHAAIVVDDPAATKAELSALYGYEWSPQAGAPLRLRLPSGETVLDVRCSYSTSAPRLEVIQSIPGTLWTPVPGSRLHHLGYWSDDVPADSAALEAKGYVCEAAGLRDDDVPFFTFYASPAGFRVELLNRSMQAGMERLWTPAGTPAADKTPGKETLS
jgi:hypothetical protein